MSPLESVTDYFLGLEAGPEVRAAERAKERRRKAIVARAISRHRARRGIDTRTAVARGTAAPLRTGTPRVVLTSEARSAMVNELCEWDAGEELESRETGGFLIGRRKGSTVVVTAAYGPGPRAVRSYGRLGLDLGYGDRLASVCGVGESVLGSWHSHPDPSPPSPRDVRHWAKEAHWFERRESEEPFHLGLIATRAARNWGFPRFSGYVSRGDEDAAEPIQIEGEPRARRDPARPWLL
jgi:JAB domain-containing protein similar to deubiquitination enzymes